MSNLARLLDDNSYDAFPMKTYLALLVSDKQPDADIGDEPEEDIDDVSPCCTHCGSMRLEEQHWPGVSDAGMPGTERVIVCDNCETVQDGES